MTKQLLCLVLAALLSVWSLSALVGCDDRDEPAPPPVPTTREVDDDAEDALDRAGEAAEDAAEKAGEATEKAGDAAKDAAEKAEEAVD